MRPWAGRGPGESSPERSPGWTASSRPQLPGSDCLPGLPFRACDVCFGSEPYYLLRRCFRFESPARTRAHLSQSPRLKWSAAYPLPCCPLPRSGALCLAGQALALPCSGPRPGESLTNPTQEARTGLGGAGWRPRLLQPELLSGNLWVLSGHLLPHMPTLEGADCGTSPAPSSPCPVRLPDHRAQCQGPLLGLLLMRVTLTDRSGRQPGAATCLAFLDSWSYRRHRRGLCAAWVGGTADQAWGLPLKG